VLHGGRYLLDTAKA